MMIISSSAHSQTCANGYDRRDRALVVNQYDRTENFILDLATIAEIVANDSWTAPERAQFDLLFQGIKRNFDRFGDQRRQGASVRTNKFLQNVLDSSYLKFLNSKVSGLTNEESQENARNALDVLNQALLTSYVCLKNSFQAHTIVGTVNDGVCGGGYDSRDKSTVLIRTAGAKRIVTQMASYAEKVANDNVSWLSIRGLDADFQFLKQELDIYGSKNLSNVSPKTRKYLMTVLDPIFLGLIDLGFVGLTIEESQNRARSALDVLNQATFDLSQCSFQ